MKCVGPYISTEPQQIPSSAVNPGAYAVRGTPPPLPVAPAHLTPSLPGMDDLITGDEQLVIEVDDYHNSSNNGIHHQLQQQSIWYSQ